MSESVRCKMRVTKLACLIHEKNETSYEITLNAVYEGSPENKEFFKWTPNGQLTLLTVNPGAAEIFKGLGEFYVDITKVRPSPPTTSA